MSRLRVVVVAVIGALAVAGTAHAAAPRFILVSGPRLEQPVVLGDWAENLFFLQELSFGGRPDASVVRSLPRRPRYDLAMFWEWTSDEAPRDPDGASQHGWFYPAYRGRPAVSVARLNGKRMPRIVSVRALWVLSRHGVPVRLR
jgi:hypothetical protein